MKANIFKEVSKNVSKNSPVILTSISVVGVATTAILAVKATPKAMRLIEELEEQKQELQEPVTKKDIIKETWKCYIPAMVVGGATVACIIGSTSISTRRNAALASVYSLSEKAMKEYQAKVVETIGEKKNQEIKDKVAAEKLKRDPVGDKEIVITGNGEMLCYDALSGRYFKSDIEKIKSSINQLNRDLLSEMYLTLNDVYYTLGLAGTKLGDQMGWHVDNGLIDPRFSSQLTENGVPCLVLDFTVEPKYGRDR